MRALILSDMHGRRRAFEQAVEQQPTAVHVFFLGDGAEEAKELSGFYPDRVFHLVAGNCDFCSPLPGKQITELAGVTVFATHGHLYSVKSTTDRLLDAARQAGARLALFGHTHNACVSYEDGIYLVNPGALCGSGGYASYATVDITDAGIVPNIIRL